MFHRRTPIRILAGAAAAGLATAFALPVQAAGASAVLPSRGCAEVPEPLRWLDAGTPDRGLDRPLISAHRGYPSRAPENTVAGYAAAFEAGADLVEVDVRETTDGHFVAFHDDTVDDRTDGAGPVEDMTLAQATALNVADNDQWRGSAFDPSPMATLPEVLELARDVGGGVELDVKTADNEAELANMLADHGLLDTSIIAASQPLRVLAAQPTARIIYNKGQWETPPVLYALGSTATVFGSRLDDYTPEAVVAIHDACALVLPHSYDLGPEREAEQALAARAIGADGVQTNQPDVVAEAFGRATAGRRP